MRFEDKFTQGAQRGPGSQGPVERGGDGGQRHRRLAGAQGADHHGDQARGVTCRYESGVEGRKGPT